MQEPTIPIDELNVSRSVDIFATSDQLVTMTLLDHIDFSKMDRQHVIIETCLVDGCQFTDASLSQLEASDVRFENCDFSNCQLDQAALYRCQFSGCKFTGADLTGAYLSAVIFDESPLNLATLDELTIKQVQFTRCDLSAISLRDCAKPQGLRFEDCRLTGALITDTPLKQIDLTTCQFEYLETDAYTIRGAIVTAQQAGVLATQLLGLKVQL